MREMQSRLTWGDWGGGDKIQHPLSSNLEQPAFGNRSHLSLCVHITTWKVHISMATGF